MEPFVFEFVDEEAFSEKAGLVDAPEGDWHDVVEYNASVFDAAVNSVPVVAVDTDSGDVGGMPSWALPSLFGGGLLIVAVVVLFFFFKGRRG